MLERYANYLILGRIDFRIDKRRNVGLETTSLGNMTGFVSRKGLFPGKHMCYNKGSSNQVPNTMSSYYKRSVLHSQWIL